MLALANEDAELEEETKKNIDGGMSAMNQGLSNNKSPHKSLAIKGPPKIINETLEIDNYKGVKVTDINVKPVMQSVAQLRHQKEMSSIHSAHKLDTSSIHQEALSHAGSKGHMGSMSQHLGNQSPSAGEVGYAIQGGDGGFSTMGTNQKPKMRSITDVLNEKI